jgi:tripartite-type tricarboxylate transporter receptor subunit TctC
MKIVAKASLTASLLAGVLAAGPVLADNGYYAGKTLQVVVPFGEGGATAVAARFLEPFLEKHLPGNPQVEVVTRPGGGSILGANWFQQNAKPDGQTILFTTSSTSNPYVLGQQGVEYDLAAMRPAYSLPFGSIAYVSPSTGVKSAADIKSSSRPLIYGGIAAAASDLPALLSFEVLDLDVRAILGFNGRGPVRLAFARGETTLDYQFTPVYATQVVDMIKSGKATPLWAGGAVDGEGRLAARDPAFPQYPSVYEVHKELYGKEPQGPAWEAFEAIGTVTYNFGLTAYLPAGTSDEVVEIFEKAVATINADPQYQAKSKEIVGGYSLLPPSKVTGPLSKALKPSPEVVEYLRKLLSDKYSLKF